MTASAETSYLSGQLLVAMPAMGDPRFDRSVIYMCAHSEDGAMGLIVNQPLDDLDFPEILEQLGIDTGPGCDEIRVHAGGPVETSRGFVLHTDDYQQDGTMVVDRGLALTATTEVLRAIADGSGPTKRLMALGYAGWGAGQLDDEIKENAWLVVPATPGLIFSTPDTAKWDAALAVLGLTPEKLSHFHGHA